MPSTLSTDLLTPHPNPYTPDYRPLLLLTSSSLTFILALLSAFPKTQQTVPILYSQGVWDREFVEFGWIWSFGWVCLEWVESKKLGGVRKYHETQTTGEGVGVT
ncbi:hypothetical protein G7K_6536-t1 [Saitoella complicata NRRL Y-17804]|uniref:Uncharacterized protein n=1 Tax=Saitoella complicata (strain BCRC 22490 / CBS 7301 / JCM 7358 / NBRC 10748 / NRRL Y-17804) TaxID=698492 RepID=A0A0E9NS12_SAICN|nr:hypothetical protein G7K_6536-t1 [Saitoella complicata NRRL Y-17804]